MPAMTPTRLHGSDLRTIRRLKNIPIADLAARSGVHLTTISHVENGRQPLTPELERRLLVALIPDDEA